MSKYYINCDSPLQWKCKNDHIWFSSYSLVVNRGNWCWKCAHCTLSLKDAKEIAKTNEGRCLSKKYINNKDKLLWKCKCGYKWEAPLQRIKNGSWCPRCRGVARITLQDMVDLAIKRGGTCLSSELKNRQSKLLWKCNLGHEWTATAAYVKNQKAWCPQCSKLSIDNKAF